MDAYFVDPDNYWPAIHAFIQECAGLEAPRKRQPAPATEQALEEKQEEQAHGTGMRQRKGMPGAAVADWETASTGSNSEWEKVSRPDVKQSQ